MAQTLAAGLACLSLALPYFDYNRYPLSASESLALIFFLTFLWAAAACLFNLVRLGPVFFAVLVFFYADTTSGLGFRDSVFWPVKLVALQFQDPQLLFFSPVFFAEAWLLQLLKGRTAVLFASYVLALAPLCLLAMGWRKVLSSFFSDASRWVKPAGLILLILASSALIGLVFNPAKPLFDQTLSDLSQTVPAPKDNALILILDEHLGVQAFPEDLPRSAQLKDYLRSFYPQKNFTLYPRAYSNYYNTQRSLPSLFNYEPAENTPDYWRRGNRLLRGYHDKGYRLFIYQTDYLPICSTLQGRYFQCVEYNKNSTGFLHNSLWPPLQKTLVLFSAFIESGRSTLAKKILWVMSEKISWLPWGHVEPVGGIRIFDRIQADMQRYPKGSVFFAHLLLPHSPYLYDSACQLKATTKWDHRLITRFAPESTWETKHENYADQTRCTHLKIEQLLTYMKDLGIYDLSTILIFGDHGSRIYSRLPESSQSSNEWTADNSSDRDILELFSAFLAVKVPGQTSGQIIENKTASAEVIARTAGLIRPGEEQESLRKIYFQGRGGSMTAREMIDF